MYSATAGVCWICTSPGTEATTRTRDALEITTLDDGVYLSMKNDLSFLVNGVLNLYEHQSTYNPNMPVRGFFYLADVYRKYVVEHKLNLYGSRLAKLPSPKYLVFYNGRKEEPDRKILRLSDAFQGGRNAEPCLELCAVMLNINLGRNQVLMERCRTLKEYAQFVDRVRRMIAETGALESAVDCAVEDCIRDGILENFLSSHRAEVLDVILTDYNEQEYIAMEREEAWEEGRAEGLTEGLSEGLSEGPFRQPGSHSGPAWRVRRSPWRSFAPGSARSPIRRR